ncbi:MAG: DsrE family protein [Deltaproteobacteria bacterium]|nr:DsrE family protein [Deltaproteobacteria bacterium]
MSDANHLYILWTNADPLTAEKMVFMYGVNARLRNWWEEVTIIIWGAPARLIAENHEVQKKVADALAAGVKLSACKACADQLGATAKLVELGIEVKFWGEPLTRLLKSDAKILTV